MVLNYLIRTVRGRELCDLLLYRIAPQLTTCNKADKHLTLTKQRPQTYPNIRRAAE